MSDVAITGDVVFPTALDVAATEGDGKDLSETNLKTFHDHLFGGDFVLTGLTFPATSADLTLDVAAGNAFIDGRLVVVPAATTITFAASSTSYLYLKLVKDGSYRVTEAQFEHNVTGIQPADSVFLGIIITSGSAVTNAIQTAPIFGSLRFQQDQLFSRSGEVNFYDGYGLDRAGKGLVAGDTGVGAAHHDQNTGQCGTKYCCNTGYGAIAGAGSSDNITTSYRCPVAWFDFSLDQISDQMLWCGLLKGVSNYTYTFPPGGTCSIGICASPATGVGGNEIMLFTRNVANYAVVGTGITIEANKRYRVVFYVTPTSVAVSINGAETYIISNIPGLPIVGNSQSFGPACWIYSNNLSVNKYINMFKMGFYERTRDGR